MFKKRFARVPDRWLSNYAQVVVEQRFSREGNARTFAIQAGVISFFSALRWNRRVSAVMRKTFFSWILTCVFRRLGKLFLR